MLVATFFDDSFGTVTQFSGHAQQIMEQGCLRGLEDASSILFASIVATVLLLVGLLAQFLGSLCLLTLIQPNAATNAVIVWAISQPVLYGQLSNYEFVAESLSLVGGLVMLRAHLVFDQARFGAGARTQLIGRLLLPAMYLYYAGNYLFSAITLDETSNLAMYISSLSIFVVNMLVLVALVFGSALVATGLKSRLVAFCLAIVNLCFVFYQHPFFLYIKREAGEWRVDEDNMPMPNVTLPKDVNAFDFDPWQIYDLQRYYFFLGLSVSGALFLLAQVGPGEIAAQRDEVLIPDVERARD